MDDRHQRECEQLATAIEQVIATMLRAGRMDDDQAVDSIERCLNSLLHTVPPAAEHEVMTRLNTKRYGRADGWYPARTDLLAHRHGILAELARALDFFEQWPESTSLPVHGEGNRSLIVKRLRLSLPPAFSTVQWATVREVLELLQEGRARQAITIEQQQTELPLVFGLGNAGGST